MAKIKCTTPSSKSIRRSRVFNHGVPVMVARLIAALATLQDEDNIDNRKDHVHAVRESLDDFKAASRRLERHTKRKLYIYEERAHKKEVVPFIEGDVADV